MSLFFNCWNQNVVCSFTSADGARWLATFGKHSKNFPIYGASYDIVMLHDKTSRKNYGLSQEALPGLRFTWKGSFFGIEYEGPLFRYEADAPRESIHLDLSLAFKTGALPPERVFLKKLIPLASRFVPGAIFKNQILTADESVPSSMSLGGGDCSLSHLRGHLENGASSLINSRAWTIPYWYLGLLPAEEEAALKFYYRWKIRPLKPKKFHERVIGSILKNMAKEKTAVYEKGALKVAHSNLEKVHSEESELKKLFTIPSPLGDFTLDRSFVQTQNAASSSDWFGILEDFRHPDIS